MVYITHKIYMKCVSQYLYLIASLFWCILFQLVCFMSSIMLYYIILCLYIPMYTRIHNTYIYSYIYISQCILLLYDFNSNQFALPNLPLCDL